jgi:flagellar basal-body rod protein FlgF/flagellar basal-body rod protein FlgG
MARTDELDAIANNLANASTGGFRGRQSSFSEVLAGTGQPLGSDLNRATNNFGVLGAQHLDLTSGSLAQTGNPLDLGIEGSGFLEVQTSAGPAYTRNGALKVSVNGQLVTASGDAVIGDAGVINIVPNAAVTISSDGTVSANGAVAGKLKLVEFGPGADPQSLGGTYYAAPAKDVVAATDSQVRQGMLESSNVNPVSSVIELINAQRSAETMRHALTMIDADIDKVAAQELPRIS